MYKTITNECTFLFIPVRSEVFAVSLPEEEKVEMVVSSRPPVLFFRYVYHRMPDKRRYQIKCYKSAVNATVAFASWAGIFRLVDLVPLNKAA